MVDRLQGEHALNRGCSIEQRSAALTGALLIERQVDGLLIEPDGETSAVDERFVIVFPVPDTVLLLFDILLPLLHAS